MVAASARLVGLLGSRGTAAPILRLLSGMLARLGDSDDTPNEGDLDASHARQVAAFRSLAFPGGDGAAALSESGRGSAAWPSVADVLILYAGALVGQVNAVPLLYLHIGI